MEHNANITAAEHGFVARDEHLVYALRAPDSSVIRYVGVARDLELRVDLHVQRAEKSARLGRANPFERWLLEECNKRPVAWTLLVLASKREGHRAEAETIRRLVAAGEPLFNVYHARTRAKARQRAPMGSIIGAAREALARDGACTTQELAAVARRLGSECPGTSSRALARLAQEGHAVQIRGTSLYARPDVAARIMAAIGGAS